MKKLIGIVTILALLITMMPSVSYAMMDHNSITKAASAEPCHYLIEKDSAKKLSQDDKDTPCKKHCCDKSMCKCAAGFCHGNFAKIFNNSGTPIFVLAASKSQFSFVNEFIDSVLPERLKRPPKA